jgi:hypothetical protein
VLGKATGYDERSRQMAGWLVLVDGVFGNRMFGRRVLGDGVLGHRVREMGAGVMATMGAGRGRGYRQKQHGSDKNLVHGKTVALARYKWRGNLLWRNSKLHQERKQR